MSVLEFPETQYGDVKTSELDWRKEAEDKEDLVDDPDEEKASEHVVSMLGFDPDEIDEEDKEDGGEEAKENNQSEADKKN